jgi:iron-sulfur cluster assembly accessory protein|eukprot:786476_1
MLPIRSTRQLIASRANKTTYRSVRSCSVFVPRVNEFLEQKQARNRISFRRDMVTITKTSAASPNIELTKVTQAESPTASSSPLSSIQDNDSVKVTPSAIQQVHRLATQKRPEDPSKVYLRVYVDAGGCSGFQYKFELEHEDNEETPIDLDEDIVIESTLSDGSLTSKVVIDEGSMEYIKGSTVDFVREMIRSSFAIVENPMSESACGCGSSFAVKNFESNPALD